MKGTSWEPAYQRPAHMHRNVLPSKSSCILAAAGRIKTNRWTGTSSITVTTSMGHSARWMTPGPRLCYSATTLGRLLVSRGEHVTSTYTGRLTTARSIGRPNTGFVPRKPRFGKAFPRLYSIQASKLPDRFSWAGGVRWSYARIPASGWFSPPRAARLRSNAHQCLLGNDAGVRAGVPALSC